MSTQPATGQPEETRRKKRHELSKPVPVKDTLSGDTIDTLANITVEGLLLVSNKPMDENRIYQIELYFPASISGMDSISIGIDCLWVKQGEAPGLNWAGCEIIDADPATVEVIEELIREYSTSA